jgi:SAM-dependent methyltransferase
MFMTSESNIELPEQAGNLLGQVAGMVGARTIEMGLRHGLYTAIDGASQGLTAEELAAVAEIDPFYAGVWCRGAYAASTLEVDGDGRYQLAAHVDSLLLNEEHPAWVGGIFRLFVAPEIFEEFGNRLPGGERTWWDQVSNAFIDGVAGTSRPFYTRMLGGGFEQVPGLAAALEGGAHVLELAAGTGRGLVRIAAKYPRATFVAQDGDAYSLGVATEEFNAAGVGDRISTLEGTLEELEADSEFDVVFINVSMHECRDLERVTANVLRALKPGGTFVISDFPFPAGHEEMRTVPARIMSGIQYFEAMIDDQLLPTRDYVELLERHTFDEVGAFDLAPVHCVIHGRRPA